MGWWWLWWGRVNRESSKTTKKGVSEGRIVCTEVSALWALVIIKACPDKEQRSLSVSYAQRNFAQVGTNRNEVKET